jgi:hypothetical protein
MELSLSSGLKLRERIEAVLPLGGHLRDNVRTLAYPIQEELFWLWV